MKKQVALTITSRKTQIVEVEFPFYRQQTIPTFNRGGEATQIHQRIEEDGTSVSVTRKATTDKFESYEIRVDKNVVLEHMDAEYALGQGGFACTAEEFNRALEKATVAAYTATPEGQKFKEAVEKTIALSAAEK